MMNKIVAFHASCRKIIFIQIYQDIYSFAKMKLKGTSNTSLDFLASKVINILYQKLKYNISQSLNYNRHHL